MTELTAEADKEWVHRGGDKDDDIPVPDEILCMILTMVDSVDLVAARWVCKRWSSCAPAGLSILRQSYMTTLAYRGYLEVAQWARSKGCPWSDRVCVGFAWRGHLDALRWAKANGCPWDRLAYQEACAAASGGHTGILQWLQLLGRPFRSHVCASAARGGHLATLQWLRANECQWDEWTCANAALGGHTEVIKWARANGCPWDERTCANLASAGALETLGWAMAEGCPWDYRVYSFAAKKGHWDVIRAVLNGLSRGSRPARLDYIEAADEKKCTRAYRTFMFLCPERAKAAAITLSPRVSLE